MYSEEDINSAVTAGALSADAAASFRAHMTQIRDMPRGDEENFRLINSFNDIFVAIGVVIMLVAAGAIGQAIASSFAPVPQIWDLTSEPTEAQLAAWSAASEWQSALTTLFAGALIAATAWPLSEFFTRRRRMALPSIRIRGPCLVSCHGPMNGAVTPATRDRMVIARKNDVRDQPISSLMGVTKTLTPHITGPVENAPAMNATATITQP